MLVFVGCFCLYRSVPVDDDEASRSAIGLSRQSGAVAFATTTHWSVVLEAQSESPAAEVALEKLCRTYWRPLYAFVRRQGVSPDEAQDLTQGFFALLLERRDLDAVRKEKGRLRSYLLVSLKNFLTDERRRAMAIKRGKGQRIIPLEETDQLKNPNSQSVVTPHRRGGFLFCYIRPLPIFRVTSQKL